MITHDRLEYTKQTLRAYLGTEKNVPHSQRMLFVVDNASADGTREWLADGHVHAVASEQNLFPGAATNIGWHRGLRTFDAELLMRLDNDIELLPGWREEVIRCFETIPRLGQLGLLNMHEDFPDGPPLEKYAAGAYGEEGGAEIYLGNPGGVCVIRRELWDAGLRWACGGWRPGGNDEDTQFSESVRRAGYIVGRVVKTVATNQSFGRYEDFPSYYQRTAALRGLVPETSV